MLVFSFNIVSLHSLCRTVLCPEYIRQIIVGADNRRPATDAGRVRRSRRSPQSTSGDVQCSAAQCSAVRTPSTQWLGSLVIWILQTCHNTLTAGFACCLACCCLAHRLCGSRDRPWHGAVKAATCPKTPKTPPASPPQTTWRLNRIRVNILRWIKRAID